MPGSNSSFGHSHTDKHYQHVITNQSSESVASTFPQPNSYGPVGSSALAYWMDVLGQPGLPPQVLDIPGCSPVDFSAFGGTFMFVRDNNGGYGPFVIPEIPHPSGPMSAWDYYRKSHNFGLVAFTLEESYYGVGLPGTNNIDWWQGMPSAVAQYPQFSTLIDHPSCGPLDPYAQGPAQSVLPGFGITLTTGSNTISSICLKNYGLKVFRELNMYPSTFTPAQLNAGWTKCIYYIHKWITYLNSQYNHVHKPHQNHPLYTGPTQAAIPGSWSGVIYNANGNLNKFWMYKYLRLNAKAHFMQSASDGCGCGGFLMDLGWHLWDLPGDMFPFFMNGTTYSKMVDKSFRHDSIHTLMSLYAGKIKTNKKRVNKLLKVIREQAPKESYFSEERADAWFKNYIRTEDKI